MSETFTEQVAQALAALLAEIRHGGEPKPAEWTFANGLARRVAAAILAAAKTGPVPMGTPEGEHYEDWSDAQDAALAALRGEP